VPVVQNPDHALAGNCIFQNQVGLTITVEIFCDPFCGRRWSCEYLKQIEDVRYAESGAQVESRTGIIKSIRAVAARDDIAKVRSAALRIQWINLRAQQPKWRQTPRRARLIDVGAKSCPGRSAPAGSADCVNPAIEDQVAARIQVGYQGYVRNEPA